MQWPTTVDGKQTPEYQAYHNARTRCTNPNSENWPRYGARGIKFLFTSFDQFMDEIGPKPTPDHQLDRRDNDGHYEPGNVRWATPAENTNNRQRIHEPRQVVLDAPTYLTKAEAGRKGGLSRSERKRKACTSNLAAARLAQARKLLGLESPRKDS